MNANARMVLIAAACASLYLAELLLFVNLSSVSGAALLCLGLVLLAVTAFAGRKAVCGKEVWLENSSLMEAAPAAHL